jgi:hypothetical protein
MEIISSRVSNVIVDTNLKNMFKERVLRVESNYFIHCVSSLCCTG